jgi:amidohydrolase family protein
VMGGFLFYSTAGSGATGFTQQIVQDSGAIDRGMRIARGLGARYVKHRTFEDWTSAVRTIAGAHAHGLPVSGHCAHILPLVAAGIDGKEHSGDCFRDFGRIYDDFTSLYAAAGLWVDPTTGFWEPMLHLAADTALFDRKDVSPFVAPGVRALYGLRMPVPTLERGNRRNAERTAALIAAGVPLVTGTDAGMPQALHWELEALVRAGLTPSQALMAATSVAARVLGADADLGTIVPGKLADLIIIDGNPLEDIADTQRIWRVVQGGRIIDRDALLDAEAKAAVADAVVENAPAAGCPSSRTAGRAVCSPERCPPARETGRCQP